MCGIVAVVRRKATRTSPSPDDVLRVLQPLAGALEKGRLDDALTDVADALTEANGLLSGVPGVQALLVSPDLRAAVHALCAEIGIELARIDGELDRGDLALDSGTLERVNAALLRAKDVRWAVAEDRIRTAEAVSELLNGTPSSSAAVEAFTS